MHRREKRLLVLRSTCDVVQPVPVVGQRTVDSKITHLVICQPPDRRFSPTAASSSEPPYRMYLPTLTNSQSTDIPSSGQAPALGGDLPLLPLIPPSPFGGGEPKTNSWLIS